MLYSSMLNTLLGMREFFPKNKITVFLCTCAPLNIVVTFYQTSPETDGRVKPHGWIPPCRLETPNVTQEVENRPDLQTMQWRGSPLEKNG
ncbi:hypothetical protein TNCV_400321 [Trichonephila clavipes]|nr:hypothetical protein TNCV_400321 [Trichonephila clavipes]